MPLEEAIEVVRGIEEREHRANAWKRGILVHEAFETVIKAAEQTIKT